MSEKITILIDGSYFLFRAYHALPKLSNAAGEPTGAIYGMVNMLRRIGREYAPDRWAVVFDTRGETFRDRLYAQYKKNRPPMPDDLSRQFEPMCHIIKAMGLPLLCVDDVEADDVLATLATKSAALEQHAMIASGDKDLAQVVDRHIELLHPFSGKRLDAAGVEQKYGVPPHLIVDYLALVGDSVDNVPGVPGVGPKTATQWLHHYGSLEAIVSHAEQIKGKVGEHLRASLESLALSRQLVRLKLDVSLPLELSELVPSEPDVEALRESYRRWQFRQWLDELQEGPAGPPAEASSPAPDVPDVHWRIVLDEKELEEYLQKLRERGLLCFDTETTSLDILRARIVGLSFALDQGDAIYVPLGHDYLGAPRQLSRERVLERLRPLLEDAELPKLGQNLKYDFHVLANHRIHLQGIAYDTMLESYALDSSRSRHDLDSLAQRHLQHKTIHYEELVGKGAKQLGFNQVKIEEAADYAAEDADLTLRLHQHLWPALQEAREQCEVFQQLEVPLIPVLAGMERNGVLIDTAQLNEQGRELAGQLEQLERQAHDHAGQRFNLASPQQVGHILFEKLGLPVIAKTPKGEPSSAEGVLQELLPQSELVGILLQYRTFSKLKSTYTDKLPRQIHPDSGRVHTSYHQTTVITGRLSSSNPNLQNIPVRTSEGRRIRRAFIAPPGQQLLAADYSQIELRIMAHLSADARLRRAFDEDQDVHRHTAAEVFGVSVPEVSADQRRAAKAINFGLIYGMSAFGLAKQLGISRGAAEGYVQRYFERYAGVREYMDRIRRGAAELGYVQTLFGRRLYLREINARNRASRQYAERTAINAPMQGTAADIIKRAMIDIASWLEREHPHQVRMIMQVHDELVFEGPAALLEQLAPQIKAHMERSDRGLLQVPLRVDIGIADNWEQAHG